MALLVYVDDIVLAGNDSRACWEFKKYLDACFSIKSLESLKYFLGIEVAHGATGLFLIQCKYALEIGDECDLLGTSLVMFLWKKITSLLLLLDHL